MDQTLSLLLVEDSEDDALLLRRELRKNGLEFDFKRVETAEEMKNAFQQKNWDVIISDYNLPRFSTLAALEISREYDPDIPFIVISGAIGEEAAVDLMKAGAHDFVAKQNLKRLFPALERELESARIRREQKKSQSQLKASFFNLAETVSRAMGFRDPYTADHERRVAYLSRAVGQKMGLKKNIAEGLYIGGLLHDIGKIAVPESLLSRPGTLIKEEWDLIRTHAKRGYEILKDANLPWPVADMALHHHERLNGSGYPDGIKGDELSLEVRILAVCDVAEAMLSHRPYRPARTKEETLEEIRRGKEAKYDAKVADIVISMIEKDEFMGK